MIQRDDAHRFLLWCVKSPTASTMAHGTTHCLPISSATSLRSCQRFSTNSQQTCERLSLQYVLSSSISRPRAPAVWITHDCYKRLHASV